MIQDFLNKQFSVEELISNAIFLGVVILFMIVFYNTYRSVKEDKHVRKVMDEIAEVLELKGYISDKNHCYYKVRGDIEYQIILWEICGLFHYSLTIKNRGEVQYIAEGKFTSIEYVKESLYDFLRKT